MPLKKGKSKKAFEFNLRELINSWKEKGTMGGEKIKSLEKARKKALAIAFGMKED